MKKIFQKIILLSLFIILLFFTNKSLAVVPIEPPSPAFSCGPPTGLRFFVLILGLIGIILPIVGIIYLIKRSSVADAMEKHKDLKIGLIGCIGGPVLIILSLIIYAVGSYIMAC